MAEASKLAAQTSDGAGAPAAAGAAWAQGAEESFRRMVEDAPLGVIAIDADFRVRYASKSARWAFRTVEPLVGRDLAAALRGVWPEPFASEAIGRYRHTLATGEPFHAASTTRERADTGEVESYDWRIDRMELPDGRLGVVGNFADLSQEEARAARAAFLSGLSSRLASVKDPTEIVRLATWATGEFFNAERCLFYAPLSGASERVSVIADWRRRAEVASVAGEYRKEDFGPQEMWDLLSQQSVGIDDAFTHEWTHDHVDNYRALGIRSFANAPYARDGRWAACVGVVYDQPHAWTREELSLLESVVARVWPLIERAQVDAALRASEERFRAFVTASVGVIYQMNPDWSEMRQLQGGAFIADTVEPSRSWLEKYIHPADQEQVRAAITRAIRGREVFELEHRVIRADGTLGWTHSRAVPLLDERGEIREWFGTAKDVTERRTTEDDLRKIRERFDLVREAAQVGFWFCDLPFDELLWDARVKDHFWLPPDARVTIELFYARIHPDDREPTRLAIAASIADHTSYDVEYRTVSDDGRIKWIRAIGRGFYDAKGSPTRFDGVTLDVTQRKKDLDALRTSVEAARRSQQQAEAASRAKDDFLAALSHELRTPLNPVLMIAAEHASDESLPAPLREDLLMIQRSISLEARLIDDLLDLTRVSRGLLTIDPAPVDAHAILRQTVAIVRADLEGRELDLRLFLEAPVTHVRADAARLQQIFWNILKNAVKFTPDGGTITVRTHNSPAPDIRLFVSVEDTGRGISPTALERIFRPFDQGDLDGRHSFGGLGLGLAISQALVNLHGGHLRATSPGLGQGATFTVDLATTMAEPAGESQHPLEVNAPPQAWRILLVEDHAPTLGVTERLLTRDGHRVCIARNVTEARALAAKETFDLVVSDLGLPDGTGIELMQELHTRHGWPGIALSGFGMEADVRNSLAAGFGAHLVKPVAFQDLRRAIVRVMSAHDQDS